MLELYHYGFSTCSQKVRLVFAEKGLDFVSHEIDLIAGRQHDPEYVKLNPNHVVPTLVHDGTPLLESTLINEYLDEAFPDRPMRPADALGRHRVRSWTKRLDEKVHAVTAEVTFAMGPRMILLQLPEELREANIEAIPDEAARRARRSVVENGTAAPEFQAALRKMVAFLDQMEDSLASGPWLCGEAITLADSGALPYVLRLEHLGMAPLLAADARPRLADWFARMQARPSFEEAVGRWTQAPAVEFLRSNGEAAWPEISAMIARA